ncbi:helix-turn-helix domain-containing protein [Streptomyces sp. NPDC005134]|uniref:helix-turn-helix domain-containing protein n=1 Tax=Streptomyces sp. NPDC005077 TaxID=3154292 RepID=UPI0033B639E7
MADVADPPERRKSTHSKRSPSRGTRPDLTVEEAARRLSIGRTTMYGLIRDGAVPTVPFGRCRRVPVQALVDYLTQRMQTRSNHAAA